MKQTILSPVKMVLASACAAAMLWSCSEDRDASEYVTHPAGWTEPASEYFHGTPALERGGADCMECHGADFRGGASGASCYDCHAVLHNDLTADNFVTAHQQFVASVTWNLNRCALCHGADFTGGPSGFACTTCHTAPAGPSDCRACHGMPPVDDAALLYGMPSGAAGAHAAHARFLCTECHAPVTAMAHVDGLPAEISFAAAQFANAHDFAPTSSHIGTANSGNAGCNAVYCHSDGTGGPPVAMPQWVGGRLVCGACHRMPPPEPHQQIGTCHVCHTNVDPTSDYSNVDSIRFLNESLHTNGTVNF
ncbi:MAG: CxxxxCH/CxxCH domain-containing protein [bacterium]|nr:CxxxxCH/CxxCH domain-containing protein [bacterium]